MNRMRSALVLCGVLALAGCGGASPSPAAAPTAPAPAAVAPPRPAEAAAQPSAAPAATAPPGASIKVGVTPLLTVSGLYVALDRGYLAEPSVDVTMENITDPTTAGYPRGLRRLQPRR
jgi:hypothetical protein